MKSASCGIVAYTETRTGRLLKDEDTKGLRRASRLLCCLWISGTVLRWPARDELRELSEEEDDEDDDDDDSSVDILAVSVARFCIWETNSAASASSSMSSGLVGKCSEAKISSST